MNARQLLWIGLAVVLLGWLALLASGVWAYQHYGMVGVRVNERDTRVNVAVPGALVHWGLRAIEMTQWRSSWRPALGAVERRHLELAHNLAAELAKCPDGVYVRIESDHESVSVAKRDGVLEVRVAEGDQRVTVSIPAALAYRAVDFAARVSAGHRTGA